MAKKNIKTKVIAGLVSSATLINGGTLAGILANNEVETKNEAENKKRKQKNLAIIFPKDNRYLGKLYIGETTTASNDNNKIEKIVTSILKNKYHLNLDKIKINIDNNEKQVRVMTIDEDVYFGTVSLNYDLDTSPITLDYLVPDIKTRKQQVFPYLINAHEDIVTVKHQILGENEFQDLSLAANFINELSQKVKYQASSQSLAAFKKLETNNANFKDFTDLKTQFNDYNGQFKGQINLDAFIETITNNFHHYNKYNYYQINVAARINELKAQMVRFYNILAQVYGKKNVLKMLNKFEFDQQYVENHGASGRSFFGNCNDNMCSSKVILDTDNFQHSRFGIEIFIHEYGHILDFLIMNQKNNWNFNSKQHIITALAADTKITNEAYQKILAYGIIRSSYGREKTSTNFELFAEAFVRWLITPEQNRDLGWEKLDKFFRIDLVKKLSSGQ